ncbi:response regulator transcription factor [Flavobacterium jejuense]|uniref:Response regulator transcription factor n=1 Tax=Flavobacterium jejuense TaxID=1544455 RepID=A0ABX0IWH2_9FLAO|nr:LytTR family DNA-binding domain-containing protein [Flavobacterium jejuense]NHN26130.1 response regulator transcription factor [Flavobacterium jejuense]
MIHYLIVDDEPIAHRIIEKYCAHLPYLEKKGNCYNAFEAMQFLNENEINLLFLDINMPKLSGFDFLKTISNPPKIIVTTAYQEFALEGYELNISDYLLKPFNFERFVKAINKTILPIKEKGNSLVLTKSETELVASSFFLKGDKKHSQVHFKDLLFIEAYGHYTKVYLKNEIIISHEKISSFEKLLPESQFIRTHKSFIVAKNEINHIEGNRISIQNHKIPIGQTYKGNVNKLLL